MPERATSLHFLGHLFLVPKNKKLGGGPLLWSPFWGPLYLWSVQRHLVAHYGKWILDLMGLFQQDCALNICCSFCIFSRGSYCRFGVNPCSSEGGGQFWLTARYQECLGMQVLQNAIFCSFLSSLFKSINIRLSQSYGLKFAATRFQQTKTPNFCAKQFAFCG